MKKKSPCDGILKIANNSYHNQIMVLVSGIICLIVQSFLVLRVWKRESSLSLSPNRSLAVFSPKRNCSADEITFFHPSCLPLYYSKLSNKRTVSHKSIATVAILMTLVVGEFICVLGMSFSLALVRRISVAVVLTAPFLCMQTVYFVRA